MNFDKNKSVNNYLKIIIGLIMSALAIYVIANNVDLKQLNYELKSFKVECLFLLLLFYPLSIILRSIRWKLLISEKGKISLGIVIRALIIGFFVNYILPAKIGEVIRAEIIKQKSGISRSYMIGSVIAERVLDAVVLLIFLLFSSLFSKTIQQIIQSELLSIFIIILVIIILVFFLTNRRLHRFILSFIPLFRNRVDKALQNLYKALNFYKNLNLFIKTSFITLVIWIILTIYYAVIAYGLNLKLPFYGYFFLISMAAFGMILPASPGNIGVYHWVVMSAICIFLPDEKEKALSFAIISHAFDMLPAIAFGLASPIFFKTKLRYHWLKRQNIHKY